MNTINTRTGNRARKRCVVHIGMPKTGTTSIQKNLALGEETLRRAGIHYPTLGREFDAHHAWVGAMTTSRPPNYLPEPIANAEIRKELDQAYRDPAIDTVLLSSEGFFQASDINNAFREILDQYDIEILTILRHPVTYIDSSINQMIKMSLYAQWTLPDEPQDWKLYAPPAYGKALDVFRKGLPGCEIRVALFDAGRDSWSTFSSLLDDRISTLAVHAEKSNKSLAPEALAFIMDLAEKSIDWTNDECSAILSVLEDYSTESFKEGTAEFTLLSDRDVREITSAYDEDMARIERDYLSHGDGFHPLQWKKSVDLKEIDFGGMNDLKNYCIQRLLKYASFLKESCGAPE